MDISYFQRVDREAREESSEARIECRKMKEGECSSLELGR